MIPPAGERHRLLSAYFRSGWAPFIPYLLAYGIVAAMGAGGRTSSLLHVYWLLHAFHLGAAGAGLRYWWRRLAPAERRGEAVTLVPWLLVGGLYLLPGAYLEFPGDPCEHLRRIVEWNGCDTLRQHSHWMKSGYFLPYSLFGWTTLGQGMLPAAAAYEAAAALVLAWQYRRLGSAVGLSSRASIAFGLLQSLLLGNNTFSFLRYYGLSTSIISQIAAVALIRLAVERDGRLPGDRKEWVASIGILALAAANHLQGLALAGAGIAAVWLHRLVRERQWAALAALGAVTLAVSIGARVAWPRSAGLVAASQAGWLGSWGGFNLLNGGSPAARAGLQVLGGVGLLNLACGIVLSGRRQIAGWLTIIPVIFLLVPGVAIPALGIVARDHPENAVVLARLLLAIPAGLALVVFATEHLASVPPGGHAAIALAGITMLVLPSPGAPTYNRFLNLVAPVPADLAFRRVRGALATEPPPTNGDGMYAMSSRLGFVFEMVRPVRTVYSPYFYRASGGKTVAQDFAFLDRVLANPERAAGSVIVTFPPTTLYSLRSQAAVFSGHWLPQEASLASGGMAELEKASGEAGLPAVLSRGGMVFHFRSHASR